MVSTSVQKLAAGFYVGFLCSFPQLARRGIMTTLIARENLMTHRVPVTGTLTGLYAYGAILAALRFTGPLGREGKHGWKVLVRAVTEINQ